MPENNAQYVERFSVNKEEMGKKPKVLRCLSQNDHKNVRVGIFESKTKRVSRETLSTHISFGLIILALHSQSQTTASGTTCSTVVLLYKSETRLCMQSKKAFKVNVP